jgi:tRNA(adenine34) deaminase
MFMTPLPSLDHIHWMKEALLLAEQAGTVGEIPVAALIVHHAEGAVPQVIGTGHNRREADHDPSAHAEIVAMRAAGKQLGHWRLTDCTMYVTLEPCPMCAGALVQSRLPRLVYGCTDPKAGAVDTLFQLCTDPRLNHRVEVVGNVLAGESAALLKQFFAARRKVSERSD